MFMHAFDTCLILFFNSIFSSILSTCLTNFFLFLDKSVVDPGDLSDCRFFWQKREKKRLYERLCRFYSRFFRETTEKATIVWCELFDYQDFNDCKSDVSIYGRCNDRFYSRLHSRFYRRFKSATIRRCIIQSFVQSFRRNDYTGCGLTISTFWYGRIGRAETRIMASVECFQLQN